MAQVSAELDFAIDAALEQVATFDAALGAVATSFSDQLAAALGSLDQVTIPPPDTSSFQGAIEDAVAGATTTPVPVTADASEATSAVDDFVATTDAQAPEITVTADTTDLASASGDVADLGTTADTSKGKLSGLGTATDVFGAALLGAQGNVKGAADGLAGLTGVSGGTLAAVGGLAAGFGVLFDAGLQAQSAVDRLRVVFGTFADQVDHINVGGLTGSVHDLSIEVGSIPRNMDLATAKLGQLAIASGLTQQQAAGVVGQFQALSLRAVALNPQLGDAGNVMDRLGLALSRGGRFAANFGLSLSPNEIKLRALSDTGKTAAADLTLFEKATAGAEIATAKLGNTLGGDFQKGAAQTANQFKALKAEVVDALETLGRPVVAPVLGLAQDLTPVALALARVVSGVVSGLTPALAAVGPVASVAGDALGAVADALNALGPVLPLVVSGFVGFEVATTVIPAVLATVAGGLEILAGAFPLVGAAAETAAGEVASAAIAMDATPVGLLAAGLAIGAAALGIFGGGAQQATVDTKDFQKAVVDANGALTDTAAKAATKVFEQSGALHTLAQSGIQVSDVLAAINHTNSETTRSLDDLVPALGRVAGAQEIVTQTQFQSGAVQRSATENLAAQKKAVDDLIKSIENSDPPLASLLDQLERQGKLTPALVTAIAGLSSGYGDATGKAKDLALVGQQTTDVTNTQTDAWTKAKKAATDYKNALDALNGGQTDLFDTQTKMAQSLQDLLAKWVAAKGSLDPFTKAGQDNRDALTAAVKAAEAESVALDQTGKDAATAAKPLSDLAGGIAFMAAKSGESPQQIGQLLASIGLITPAAAGGIQSTQDLVAAIQGIGPAVASTAGPLAATPPAVQSTMDQINQNFDIGVAQLQASALIGGAATGTGLSSSFQQHASLEAGIGAIDGQIAGVSATLVPTANTAGSEIGAALSIGLSQGISARTGDVTAATRAVVSAAKQAAQQIAGIFSPSKVWRDEIGAQMGAGLALGLLDSVPAVKNAASDLVLAAAGAARPAGASASPAAAPAPAPAAAAATATGASAGPLIGQVNITAGNPAEAADALFREAKWHSRFGGGT